MESKRGLCNDLGAYIPVGGIGLSRLIVVQEALLGSRAVRIEVRIIMRNVDEAELSD